VSAGGAGDRAAGTGSAAEEASRLFEAVQEWAHRASTGAASQHIATGSADCQLCPVCQLISLLRGTRPEIVAHLTDAAGSLLAAARAAMDAHEREWSSRRAPDVERIDIG
jgi:Family of unknown function (DUF5304)